MRALVAGSPVGAVRRIVLYVIVALALGSSGYVLLSLVGLAALILLALTDRAV